MVSKKVAGTVMLHLKNGSKKFLVHGVGDSFELTSVVFSEEIGTGLANILQALKEEASLNVNNINLVELTNGHIDNENIPLFVFETEEAIMDSDLSEGYYWEEPEEFQKIIRDYEIEGVPLF